MMKEPQPDFPSLPQEVRFSILALLPPNDLALGARLSSKDAAERFSAQEHCTATIGQPLPGHVLGAHGGTEDSLGQLGPEKGAEAAALHDALKHAEDRTFVQKLQLLTKAAAIGNETNVEFVLQMLQPCFFPELLQSDYYRTLLDKFPCTQLPNYKFCLGSAVVASGLAHMLPSLAQRVPWMLDPACTLEAAAKHCDLASLQAAWQLLGPRLQASLEQAQGHFMQPQIETGLAFIQRMEECGYLGPMDGPALLSANLGASMSSRDSAAKLRWLRVRGVAPRPELFEAAARAGNLEALQYLLELVRGYFGDHVSPPATVLAAAVQGGHVPVATWLLQEGTPLADPSLFHMAVLGKHVPMVRWLLEAGCPREDLGLTSMLVTVWPSNTLEEGEALVQVARMLAAAGWPVLELGVNPVNTAALMRHPWRVLRELWQLLPPATRGVVPERVVKVAAEAGCEETLEALVGLGVLDVGHTRQQQEQQGGEAKEEEPTAATTWYATAAANGDRGMLACLRRLGVPLGEGAVVEAVEAGAPLSALRWLVEHGAAVGAEGVRRALGMAARGYRREEERQGVEAWLRGLGGGEAGAMGGAV